MKYLLLLLPLFFSCKKYNRPHNKPHGQLTVYTDVYIIAGQSNCGRAKWKNATPDQKAIYGAVNNNFKIYNNRYDYFPNRFPTPLQAGVNTMLYTIGDSTEFGPEVSLFTKLAEDGKKGYIIKVGIGNTDLATQWAVDKTCYTYLRHAVDSSIKYIRQAGYEPKFKVFIWMQGENDATNKQWASDYLKNLVNFFSYFESDFREYNSFAMTKVIGRINGSKDGSEIYRDTVRKAQKDFCDLSQSILINTDSYELQDGVHYSINGQIQFGLDIYNAIK